MILDEGSG